MAAAAASTTFPRALVCALLLCACGVLAVGAAATAASERTGSPPPGPAPGAATATPTHYVYDVHSVQASGPHMDYGEFMVSGPGHPAVAVGCVVVVHVLSTKAGTHHPHTHTMRSS